MWPFGKRDADATTESGANKNTRAELLWKQGNRYLARDRFDRAITSFEEAMTLEPSRLEGRLNFGAALYLAKRPEEALPHLQYVLALEPQNTAGLLNIAAVYDALGRLDESVGALERLVSARPNWADANYNLAIAYVKQKRYDDATTALRRELTLNPKHEAARTLLNDVHLKPRPRKASAEEGTEGDSEPGTDSENGA
ncbi:tetratricopeptide repeat protein [bacterium]|nr:MAG: tetratricopeptide repeat protein [bacterium]